jgi:amidohydrolase
MQEIDTLKEQVCQEVDGWRGRLIEIADWIFAHPELGFEERGAVARLSGLLEQNGFRVERGVAGLETAFVAARAGRAAGPTIALLAEYDALPELGHACAHNLIGTASVGAGLALRAVLPALAGTVQVIGTPAEEGGGGKILMVEAGVFNGVDAAMMIHPANENLTRRRSKTSHTMLFEFFGKASHASAAPDRGINALDALIQTFNGINALRQHLREEARVHGIITAGGSAANIIPDYAAGRFNVRADSLEYAGEIIGRIRACAEAGALATGARLQFNEPEHYLDAMWPNPKLAELMEANLAALGIEVRPPAPDDRMGSTDMGNVSQVVPALHAYVAIADEDVMGHTVEFRAASGSPAGHEGMIQAAKALAMTTVDLLADPEAMTAVKRAFSEHEGRG